MWFWSEIFKISCESSSAKVEDLGIAFRIKALSFHLSNTVTKHRKLMREVNSCWQHIAAVHNSNNGISFVPNSVPSRIKFPVCLLLVLHLLCASCVNVHCHSPVNVAENIGERVFMNCSSDNTVHPCQNIVWAHYPPHNLDPTFIFMGGNLSSLVSNYTSIADSNDGHCNLVIKTQKSAEGKYECFSTSSTGKKESASLIILAGYPECDVNTFGEYFNITCWVKYFGDWAPTMEWIAMTGQNSTSISSFITISSYESHTFNQIVGASLLISRNVPSSYKFILKFNEQGRKTKTTATNVPHYEWTSPIFGEDRGGEGGEKVTALPMQRCSADSFGFSGRVIIISLFLWLS